MINCHCTNRLWTFNSKHQCWQSILYDLCDGWNPARSRHVPGENFFCKVIISQLFPFSLQSIGERLNKFASVIIRRAKIFFKCSYTEATEINLMAATGFLSSIIILTGAAVFSRYEGWSYFDSFYYCFGEF